MDNTSLLLKTIYCGPLLAEYIYFWPQYFWRFSAWEAAKDFAVWGVYGCCIYLYTRYYKIRCPPEKFELGLFLKIVWSSLLEEAMFIAYHTARDHNYNLLALNIAHSTFFGWLHIEGRDYMMGTMCGIMQFVRLYLGNRMINMMFGHAIYNTLCFWW